jgi:hypothetical protein
MILIFKKKYVWFPLDSYTDLLRNFEQKIWLDRGKFLTHKQNEWMQAVTS